MNDEVGKAQRVVMPNGRYLAGRSFGPDDGYPVLLVAGAATGKSMCFGVDILDELHIRVLTMDRPGMGESSTDASRTLESTAGDYRVYVAGVLGAQIDDIPVIANSQGAMFGMAIALAGWASRLTLVSPADEISHPAIHAMLPVEATQLADLARDNPDEARKILGTFTPETMEAMVLSGSGDADLDYYTRPEFLRKYRAALREGFANDGDGYVQDTLMAMRTWGLNLGDIRGAVNIFYGSEDRSHSPDLGATLAARFSNARREVIPEAGGALLWTHARFILSQMTEESA